MTKVLLDTNIIIHRENDTVSNCDIGALFYWIDKLNLTKMIHPLSIEEISKYHDRDLLEVLTVKLGAYEKIHTKVMSTKDFCDRLIHFHEKTPNDKIDN